MLELLWLLLPVAAASGWWMARRDQPRRDDPCASNADYFQGLNYLLDDKPDQAIEVFLRMVKVDRDTAETHLTLGSLFRRRGEVDRAIHIHRDLIARPNLTPVQRSRALLELGEDYMRAGLFDRAESLFRDLAGQSEHTSVALDRLVEIYKQEKDWRQALNCCDRLQQVSGESRSMESAHYCCELAEQASAQGQTGSARRLLQEALARDAHCVRASILAGRIAMAAGDHAAALAAFRAVEEQERGYFPEVIGLLEQCFTALDQRDQWLDYLHAVQGRDHSGRVTAALAELLEEQRGEAAALAFLEAELREYPTVLGLRCFIDLKRRYNQGASGADLDVLARISRHLLDEAARYRCLDCGFVGRSLHWCCPGCKTWNSIKPIPDLVFRSQN